MWGRCLIYSDEENPACIGVLMAFAHEVSIFQSVCLQLPVGFITYPRMKESSLLNLSEGTLDDYAQALCRDRL